jgi:hypothetical protein
MLACARGPTVQAPPPVRAEEVDSLPQLPPSRLNVPVTYDLTPILEDLEGVVPYRFGSIEERIPLPSNRRMHVAFEAERSRFTALVRGDTARISATIRYRGRGWYDPPIGPEISGSCGTSTDNDNRPRAIVTMSGRIGLTREWHLEARTRVEGVTAATETVRDECRVTALRIDVTERVVHAARSLLEKNTTVIDSAIASVDVRSRFAEWWKILQTPIELTDSLWLLINPLDVLRGPATGNGIVLVANVGLTAAPRIMLGRRPVVAFRPLPPLDTADVGDGLHILLEGVVDYRVASDMITSAVRGRSLERAGHTVALREVRLSGIGGGRLALEVRFDGDARGRVYFVGRPHYDPETNEVHVPDLDFDVATSDMLVSGLDWLRHDEFTALLRSRARFPVGDALNEARGHLLDGLNRNLSDDVRLTGAVDSVGVIGVHPTMRAIFVRAHARATARLDVREPS